ncbi:MAG: AAA family ATPase, partial [candidate division NC10 bacterium]|nr:AAA family ATPase [candidate division NC10 bacterium]
MNAREWSPQQEDVFRWFKGGDPAAARNLVVRARAGTGKTNTIVEAIDRAPERSVLLAAFNKRIAMELVTRLHNPCATAKTLHAVGFDFVRRNWRGVRVDDDRKYRLARRTFAEFSARDRGDRRPGYKIEESAPDHVVGVVAKLAAAGKNVLPLIGEPGKLVDVANVLGIALENGWAEEYSQEDLAL